MTDTLAGFWDRKPTSELLREAARADGDAEAPVFRRSLSALQLVTLGIGGIIGALGTGILVNPALGGTGVMDYVTGKIADYDLVAQMTSQAWGVSTTLVWSGVGSAILYKVVDVIVGLRATVEVEREGLDITEHTERAYNM